MILAWIAVTVLPEKQLEFRQTLLSMIEPIENEIGCRRFSVLCDIENENFFNIIEEWETREDLNRHIKSHRFSILLGSKALLREPLKIKIFTISETEGNETIAHLRKK